MAIETEGAWLPRASSTYAEPYDAAWNFNLWVSIFFFAIVMGPMAYFAVKYKRKSETERTSPIDHNLKLEIFWTAIPTLLLIYMFWIGFKIFANAQVAPNDAMTINVTGQMYSWKFQYPDGTTCNELGVPKGRPVKLVMSSIDTIHSFFVPEFRLKADVVPNLYTTMWFEPTKEMESVVECAEYCGTGHSTMLTRVFVMPSGDADTAGTYENWMQNGCEKTPLPPLARGQKKYTQICKSCHSLDGSRLVGPSFKGLWGRQETLANGQTITVDENYIKKSIMTPSADIVQGYPDQMPPMAYLKDQDIEGIIAFLKEQK
ncbi:MAG: cytochrome c oxidase subunit II [Polyangiaceae bacterium]|nr:cytochrome c oxidase subunit II [Polyangiaceae bacterium]